MRPALDVPVHPILVAATIVVTAWLDAAVSPYAATRSLLVAFGLALVLTVIASAVARSAQVGALAATAILLALWSRVALEFVLEVVGAMGFVIGVVWLLLVALLVILLVRRTRGRWSTAAATTALNRGSALVLLAALLLGMVNGRLPSLLPDFAQGGPISSLYLASDAAEDRPDVYAILLDGYPRADVLDYAFGIDNSAFVDALTERGFTVASESHSNYLWTHVSLPTTLNMTFAEQIPEMRAVIDLQRPRQPTLRQLVSNSAAFGVARDAGYTTVAIGSGFEEVAARQADVYLDGGQLNEFEISLLTSTFVADLIRPFAPDVASGQQRERIRHNLAVLPDIAGIGGAPVFVFAHVPSPHQPVVFGPDGQPVAEPLRSNWFADSPGERGQDPEEFRERYRAQLPVLNDLVLDAIDGILAASDEPPIIVVFADHGSASAVDWNETEPAEADPARLLERTGTLFAAFTPGRTDVFPDDVSNVDIFRLLFDAYLGTEYGPATPPEGGGHVQPVDASVLDD
ncbi:MAG TPA: hypothetical protein VHR55_12880 [Candidatus Limnocylindria bacterium]|nr:hypothetical protein [Candidatus Limnocylindria bacterium]